MYTQLQDKNLYELLRRKEQYSWYQENDYQKYIKDTISELLELQEWIENNDWENIEEELMDVIMQIWQLINKLLNDWLINKLDFWKQKSKILKRSPNLKLGKYIWLQQEHYEWMKYKASQR